MQRLLHRPLYTFHLVQIAHGCLDVGRVRTLQAARFRQAALAEPFQQSLQYTLCLSTAYEPPPTARSARKSQS